MAVNRHSLIGIIGAWLCFFAGVANLVIFFILLPLIDFEGHLELNPVYRDALHMAMELGRLDLISAILAIIGILIGILAIVGFGYIHYRVDKIASDRADEVAKEVAEEYNKKRDLEESNREKQSEMPIPPEDVDISNVEKEGQDDDA